MSVKVFEINEYIQEHRVTDNKNEDSGKRVNQFRELINQVKSHFDGLFDNEKIPDEVRTKRIDVIHNAVIGNENAEVMLTNEISEYLLDNNLSHIEYPSVYHSLAQAIYHEIYRFGIFYKWNLYPDSPSAKIQGKEIWFKINGEFVKQDVELRDEEHIQEIIRDFQMGNKGLKLNESNPEAEVEMQDGTRVTIVIPPRSFKPTITFRRFIVKNFSFTEQASKQTIPYEDVEFYKTTANLYLNTIIAGHVESGKSTILKTFYGARDPRKVALLIESSPETFLKRDFPERLVHDFYTLDADVNKVIRTALRVDHNYMIVQEVRGTEAEGAISGTERGSRGLLMTYHITDPSKTAEQLAQHITDEFPNRRISNEVRRISKQLDIGITMETFEGNKKKVTSMYEMCYEYQGDRAWINYLIKYNRELDEWEYNSNVSNGLIERMEKNSPDLSNKFIEHLKKREKSYPMNSIKVQPIIFKE
jgi:pilus assembly protein CpaF